jgi:hypothetical protein
MRNDGMAIASMVLGIVAIVFSFLPGIGWLSLICAIVGLILGMNSKRKIRESNGQLGGAGMATAGIVLNIICLVLYLLVLVACGLFAGVILSGM